MESSSANRVTEKSSSSAKPKYQPKSQQTIKPFSRELTKYKFLTRIQKTLFRRYSRRVDTSKDSISQRTNFYTGQVKKYKFLKFQKVLSLSSLVSHPSNKKHWNVCSHPRTTSSSPLTTASTCSLSMDKSNNRWFFQKAKARSVE